MTRVTVRYSNGVARSGTMRSRRAEMNGYWSQCLLCRSFIGSMVGVTRSYLWFDGDPKGTCLRCATRGAMSFSVEARQPEGHSG